MTPTLPQPPAAPTLDELVRLAHVIVTDPDVTDEAKEFPRKFLACMKEVRGREASILETLTPREHDLLKEYRAYRHVHGMPPTLVELGRRMGICKVTAFGYAKSMTEKGVFVPKEPNRSRNLILAEGL